MSLLSRLREKQSGKIATATPVTFATHDGVRGRTVASVATVNVAKALQGHTLSQAKVGTDDTVASSRWWLIHYPGRAPLEVACYPKATHTEIMERHQGAVAAKPFTPTVRKASTPLTSEEETAIRAWLSMIEETDPATVAEVIDQCQRDAEARAYFTGRATTELPAPEAFLDDRRTCKQCLNLVARKCLAAQRGEIAASRNYEPITDLLQRCVGYSPRPEDPDRRHGRERWQGLNESRTRLSSRQPSEHQDFSTHQIKGHHELEK